MSQVRVHNFSVSLDGFGAGEGRRAASPMPGSLPMPREALNAGPRR